MLTAHQVHFEFLVTFLAFMTGARGPCPTPTVLTRSAFVTTDEPRERDDEQESKAYEFGKLNGAQAMALRGNCVMVRPRINKAIAGSNGQVTYQCKGEGYADRYVSFRNNKPITSNQANKRELVVEAKLLMETSLRLNGNPQQAPYAATGSRSQARRPEVLQPGRTKEIGFRPRLTGRVQIQVTRLAEA